MTRDLGKSSSGGSADETLPGFPETSPSRSLLGPGTETCRLWRGELSLRGALSAYRTVNTPCREKSPRQRRTTLRDHAPARERSAITPQNGNTRRSPARRSRTAGTEPGPLRKNRTESPRRGRALAGQVETRRVPREATCLIMSHATVSRTAATLRDHVRDRDHGRSPRSGQRRCSVIMPANMITDDRPCQERLPDDPGS